MGEFSKTNKQFHKKTSVLNNYKNVKAASQQWQKLYEDEHRRRIKLEEEIIMLKQEIAKHE